MEFMPSKSILDANILEINIPEDDYPLYDEEEEVGLGAYRMFLAENIHHIYKSVVAENVGNPLDDTDSWRLVNTTNARRMFDDSITSQCEREEFIDVTLGLLGRINGLFLGNLDATTVRIVIRDGTTAVQYDKSYRVTKKEGGNSIYNYFFGDRVRIRDLYVGNLPYFVNQTVQIIISKPGSIAKCGVLVVGKAVVFGETQMGFTVGMDDYTVKNTDEDFGYTTLVERDYRKYNDLIVEVPFSKVDQVSEKLADNRGRFCVFVGTRRLTSTQVYGFFESFKHVVDFDDAALLYLSVKGIT